MSENSSNDQAAGKASEEDLKLKGLFAFKLGMSTMFDEKGEAVPVTLLQYRPMFVSQVKTKQTDGYEAVQLAFGPRRVKRSTKSEVKKLTQVGMPGGAYFVREIRQALPQGASVGQKISLESFVKGDFVSVRARSKGRGFQGSVKRFGFAGGPAAHGSKFHRQPGSSGNRTWPGRIMPGKRFPGHLGDETVTIKNLKVVDVIADENVLVVKGAVPGAANTLVQVTKE